MGAPAAAKGGLWHLLTTAIRLWGRRSQDNEQPGKVRNITGVQQRVHIVAESPVASPPPNNMANMKFRLGKVA